MASRLAGMASIAMFVAAAPLCAAFEPPPDCPKTISICIQSSDTGQVDLNTGIAELDGNVQGYMRTQQLKFSADTLKAFRDKNNVWARLVLDRNVRIDQPDTLATAEHTVLTREKAVLSGNGRVERPPYLIEGNEIEMDDASRRITAIGSPEAPVRVEYRIAPNENGGRQSAGSESAEAAPETIFVRAVHAVIDSKRDEILLTGQAEIERPEMNWRLQAHTAQLRFTSQRQLRDFRAEGGVKIEQPERTMRSDIAISRNNNETILLIGNARVKQRGNFQITADRLEVFTDATKGVVQSENKDKPIKLAIDITPKAEKQELYMLDENALQSLGGKGLPFETLAKLHGLQGRGFADQSKLEATLRGVLSATEVEQFMEAIIAHAK